MLSFGIEFSRAFSIAFCSAMFPPGSGPPSRAATMIARVSFEKSWPRFASVAPFFRLIDAHLLCPDKACLPDRLEEELVDARVVRQLGVEGSDQEPALPEEHGAAVELGEHLDIVAGHAHARGTDKHASEGLVLSGQVEVRFETEHLPAVRVARDLDVDESEVVAVEHDQARARAENRLLEARDRLLEPVEPHQARERRRLATGDDEPVEPLQLLRLAHLHHLGAEPPQHCRVLAKVPLESEDADFHALKSRVEPTMRFLRNLLGRADEPKEIDRYAATVYRSTSPGGRSAVGDREYHVEGRQLGKLVLPSGRLAACDPWVGVDGVRPFQRSVAPGRYRVEARIAVFADNGDQRVACTIVRLGPDAPEAWEAAVDTSERSTPRRVDELWGYGVDSGTGCFGSPEALEALAKLPTDGTDDDPLLKALEVNDVPTWSHAGLEVGPDLNVIAFSTGFGDGAYATFWGLDASGAPVCALTDFGLVPTEVPYFT